MKRRLLLMRHAESVSNASSDHARELTERGCRRAHEVALALLERDLVPHLVLSSDARRTVATWQAMIGALGSTLEARWSRSLYLGGHNEIVDAVTRIDASVPSVLVLGHNPGLSSSASLLGHARVQLAPANVAILDTVAPTWTDAMMSAWELVEVM